jgi:hypothetical protein
VSLEEKLPSIVANTPIMVISTDREKSLPQWDRPGGIATLKGDFYHLRG